MSKNRSVVIVRHNDAIDGVLCKVRHFFGIVLRLGIMSASRCFGASGQQPRLCSNFGWSNTLRFQFSRVEFFFLFDFLLSSSELLWLDFFSLSCIVGELIKYLVD